MHSHAADHVIELNCHVAQGNIACLPLVSIIIASYNCCTTIETALQSVILQNYSNMQLIVIDGGSSDGTYDIILRYKENIDYHVSEPDCGVYDAFNKAIDRVDGEWLYFLGADDEIVDRDVLSTCMKARSNSKMIYGNVIYRDSRKKYDGKFTSYKLCHKNICQQAIFYHRDLFARIGKFNTCYKILADWDFNMRCFAMNGVNPVYVEFDVAIYSEAGLSSITNDNVFFESQASIIKHNLGLWYYLYYIVCKIRDGLLFHLNNALGSAQ
jgi:glycosyltransferase involved in cell wall biosynthesis